MSITLASISWFAAQPISFVILVGLWSLGIGIVVVAGAGEFYRRISQKNVQEGWQFFVGRWLIGRGEHEEITFPLLLRADWTAERQGGNSPISGTWDYCSGQAIAYFDDWQGILRCTPDGVVCLGFEGNLPSEQPRKLTEAFRKTENRR